MDPKDGREPAFPTGLRSRMYAPLKSAVRKGREFGRRDGTGLESLLQDLAYGLRALRKNPVFAGLAAITLALGIGATTAVFSLVNAVLLRPLPYRDPERLVFLFEPAPRIVGVPLEAFGPFNGEFSDWQKQSRSFANLALFTNDRMNLSVNETAVRVDGSRVTGETTFCLSWG